MTELQRYRGTQLKHLPAQIGVYALCDLDNVPIYVGQSKDGLRARVRRHLTSERSDVIANRQIDVWEVAYVWAWPVGHPNQLDALEAWLFYKFDREKTLMNGSRPEKPRRLAFDLPEQVTIQVLPDAERALRLRPELRMPRQIHQLSQLVDYVLTVKDATHLRASLRAHFERLTCYYEKFLESARPPSADESDEGD